MCCCCFNSPVNWLNYGSNQPERKCVDKCEAGTFGSDDGECLPCHPSCKTCFGQPNYCTSCSDGYKEKEGDENSCVNEEGCRDDQYHSGKLMVILFAQGWIDQWNIKNWNLINWSLNQPWEKVTSYTICIEICPWLMHASKCDQWMKITLVIVDLLVGIYGMK